MNEDLPDTAPRPFPLSLESVKGAIAQCDKPVLLSLILVNIIPIALTLLFSWNIGDVMLFYWWENVVVGFFAIFRIGFARQTDLSDQTTPRWFRIPFFIVHYSIFCFVHMVFLRVFFAEDRWAPFGGFSDLLAIVPEWGWIGIMAMFVSHGFSFASYYISKGEFRRTSPSKEMFRPYARIVLLHLCILAGGFAVLLFGAPVIMVILLMIGKILMDIVAHCLSHGTGSRTEPADMIQDL